MTETLFDKLNKAIIGQKAREKSSGRVVEIKSESGDLVVISRGLHTVYCYDPAKNRYDSILIENLGEYEVVEEQTPQA